MAGNYICGGDTYTCGVTIRNNISLPVKLNSLPDIIEVEGEKFLVKDEFHVSLLCMGKHAEKHQIEVNFQEEIINDFCEFVKDKPVALSAITDEWRLVLEDEKKSLVVMCEVNNLKDFIDLINEKYQLNFAQQPTHVTVYTSLLKRGIYLIDQDDLDTKTKIISAPVDLTL